jgi:Flp pilus assembly pilin Flp
MKLAPRNRKNRRGQGMTEYVIIVALIAIAAIGVVTVFGNNILKLFGASTDALAGENKVPTTKTTDQANAKVNKNIKDFATSNQTQSE